MITAMLHKIYAEGATLLLYHFNPWLSAVKQRTEREQEIFTEVRSWQYYNNPKRIDELRLYYDDIYSNDEDIIEAYDFSKSGVQKIKKNSIFLLKDTRSRFYNVQNSLRVTTDTPSCYEKNIYIFGNCVAAGAFVEDQFTVASCLQRLLNKSQPNGVCVVGAANWTNIYETARQILSPMYHFSRESIVVVVANDAQENKITPLLPLFDDQDFIHYHNITDIFNSPRTYKDIVFDSDTHIGHRGYQIIAEHIHGHIDSIMKSPPRFPVGLSKIFDADFVSMLEEMRSTNKCIGKNVGAVVMNCNPFTLGHRYLIEQAKQQCDYLYIFVVEENKSFFSYDDRLSMVKAGVEDMDNISVVPSGKMILSDETLPEYFTKEKRSDIQIDPNNDLITFATVIAKALGITVRFAGAEPYCYITRQYNDGMRNILPKYGLKFVEMERKDEISASKVRECLDLKNFTEVQDLVPASTFAHLIKMGLVSVSTEFKDGVLEASPCAHPL